jgi:hypothetical protein
MRLPWTIIGHHHDEREQLFSLTVQRNGITRILNGVSLDTYRAAVDGSIQEIHLPPTREDIAQLEEKVRQRPNMPADRPPPPASPVEANRSGSETGEKR